MLARNAGKVSRDSRNEFGNTYKIIMSSLRTSDAAAPYRPFQRAMAKHNPQVTVVANT